MKPATPANAADSRQVESTAAQPDRLLHFREVHALIGSSCRTGHTARALAARNQIKAVRINGRVIRYSEASVRALIAGTAA
jgi:predicted DNA-binding transcriptional regulator AlpA